MSVFRTVLASGFLAVASIPLCAAISQPASLSASSAAIVQPLTSPTTVALCWEIFSAECTDCPGSRSWFCNPVANGQFVTCVPAQAIYCEPNKGCVNVAATTGATCPNP